MKIEAELSGDGQQFPRTMGACVTGADGFQPVSGQRDAQVGIMRKIAQTGGHFRDILGEQEVLAGAEQVLAVGPRGRDQRDSAGQRLEDADRGDAGQHRRVEAARDVDGRHVAAPR